MSVRRNVVANYLGQAWVAVMGLAFVPVYIRYLGVEAYGLIGLFALLQAWLALLDMGMTPTLMREMARYTAGQHGAQSIADLLRSIEWVFAGIGVAVFVVVHAASSWLAADWLRVQSLPVASVAGAIGTMALVIGLRLVESVYRSALFGLQRQVWYNAANAGIATLRGIGAVTVLAFVAPTIEAFFIWQAAVSLASVALLAWGAYRALPAPPARPVFSVAALRSVWRFAGGMFGITFLAVLLTQVDKVLLSRLLTLENFGYYTLASTVATALLVIVTPVTTALYPRLVELVSSGDAARLSAVYHRGAQLVTVLAAPAALLLVCFGEGAVYAWSGSAELARQAGPILAALSLGTLFNGLMYMPYHLQLAHGWTRLTLSINVVAVLLLVPAIFWAVPHHGALGAAAVWFVLNAGYVLVAIRLMHARILPGEQWRWYLHDVGLPAFAAAAALLALHALRPAGLQSRIEWIAFLLLALTAALTAAAATLPVVRARIALSVRRTART